MNLAQKLTAIFAAVLNEVANFKPTTNIGNVISDLILTLGNLQGAGVSLPEAVLADVNGTAAGVANLAGDQAALVGTVPASFNGQHDNVLIVAVRESSPLAKQLLGV